MYILYPSNNKKIRDEASLGWILIITNVRFMFIQQMLIEKAHSFDTALLTTSYNIVAITWE